MQLGLGLGTGNGYFIAFFSCLKVTNTFVLPSWLQISQRSEVILTSWVRHLKATLDNPRIILYCKDGWCVKGGVVHRSRQQ